MSEPLSIGMCAQLACVLEVTARKPGNVHRHADFADTTYLDYLLSAAAIGPIMDAAPKRRVGATVLDAVKATRRVCSTNTNLGILLLLAPLASVRADQDPLDGVGRILESLTVEDARQVYEAIRLAKPGGLGRVDEQDVSGDPTLSLRYVMAAAANRDAVAAQYANNYPAVRTAVRTLEALTTGGRRNLEHVIITCYLSLLAAAPDSLIVRRCGVDVAGEMMRRASEVGWPGHVAYADRVAEFDAWLRADGHRRNPGTTADLLTAALFVGLRRGTIQLPMCVPFIAPSPG